jgi:tetratricopeptide (TPR) repeat protein
MENQNIEDTSPLKIEPIAKPKRKIFLKILIGVAIILVGGGLGVWMGYNNGVNIRVENKRQAITLEATKQFQLALADQAAGNFKTAQQRIEYVISLDPNYPGAVNKLTEIMMAMGSAAIPTAIPTNMPTPTADNRGAEQLFAQAKQYLADTQWAAAVDTLDNLRRLDRQFRAIEVDGMYYVGLRYRGMDKILNGSLEEGIYDFTLTERFGPLDNDASGYRNWCRLYINGASFWGLDWGQVVDSFAQIYQSVPNLRDGSGWTATDRFRIANIKYGDQLTGLGKPCDADYYYTQALAMTEDQAVAASATAAAVACHPAVTATPEPPAAVTTEAPPPAVVTTEPPPTVTIEVTTEAAPVTSP